MLIVISYSLIHVTVCNSFCSECRMVLSVSLPSRFCHARGWLDSLPGTFEIIQMEFLECYIACLICVLAWGGICEDDNSPSDVSHSDCLSQVWSLLNFILLAFYYNQGLLTKHNKGLCQLLTWYTWTFLSSVALMTVSLFLCNLSLHQHTRRGWEP